MIVCVCHRVSDRDIHRVVHEGCRSFEDLQNELRVATACGACTDCAEQLFNAQMVACLEACSAGPVAVCEASLQSTESMTKEMA